MDLRTTAEQEDLRDEFRAWLLAHLPWPYGVGLPPRFDDLAETVAFGRRWQADLAADGWVGVTWPEKYGGRGLGRAGELRRDRGAGPGPGPRAGGPDRDQPGRPDPAGPRDAEQKDRFLPRILSADELWCQLFSEPDAGSDLASLTTRAVPVDGGYRVSGRKVWTSYAQFADWGLCLTRSDPDAPKRQQGITALIIDMHADGVVVHPLVQSTGEAEFNEVELHDVFVPDDRRVGTEGEGWTVAGLHAGPRTRHQPAPARHPLAAHRGAFAPGQ